MWVYIYIFKKSPLALSVGGCVSSRSLRPGILRFLCTILPFPRIALSGLRSHMLFLGFFLANLIAWGLQPWALLSWLAPLMPLLLTSFPAPFSALSISRVFVFLPPDVAITGNYDISNYRLLILLVDHQSGLLATTILSIWIWRSHRILAQLLVKEVLPT